MHKIMTAFWFALRTRGVQTVAALLLYIFLAVSTLLSTLAYSAPDATWLQSHALAIEHSEMLAPLDDMVALGPVFANIQVVYLGESTHDDGGMADHLLAAAMGGKKLIVWGAFTPRLRRSRRTA